MAAGTEIALIKARGFSTRCSNPTIAVDVKLSGGAMGHAAVPSGASTGVHEALELCDGDAKRFGGKGVQQRLQTSMVRIARRLKGMDALDQKIDRRRDDRPSTEPRTNRSSAANAMLGVLLAAAHAGATSRGEPLYRYRESRFAPDAGADDERRQRRASRRDSNVDMQEFMIVPVGADNMAGRDSDWR